MMPLRHTKNVLERNDTEKSGFAIHQALAKRVQFILLCTVIGPFLKRLPEPAAPKTQVAMIFEDNHRYLPEKEFQAKDHLLTVLPLNSMDL